MKSTMTILRFAFFATTVVIPQASAVEANTWEVRNIGNPGSERGSVPRMAQSSGRDLYLSWVEPSTNGPAFRFAEWRHGRWSETKTIAAGPQILAATSSEPGLIDAGHGILAAQWLVKAKEKEANHIVVAVSRDAGLHWTPPVMPYRDSTPGEHMYVFLFPWPGGGAGVVWLDPRGGKLTELIQTSIDPSGRLGPEQRIREDVCSCCPTSSAITERGPVLMYRNRTASDVRDMYLASLTLVTLSHLAETYLGEGRYEDAESADSKT